MRQRVPLLIQIRGLRLLVGGRAQGQVVQCVHPPVEPARVGRVGPAEQVDVEVVGELVQERNDLIGIPGTYQVPIGTYLIGYQVPIIFIYHQIARGGCALSGEPSAAGFRLCRWRVRS